jgi:hypothetical protein
MNRDSDYWKHWEKELKSLAPVNPEQNFHLNDFMYRQARQMGLITRANPLDGLEPALFYAQALNVPRPSRPAV